jgi:hypothetical protein
MQQLPGRSPGPDGGANDTFQTPSRLRIRVRVKTPFVTCGESILGAFGAINPPPTHYLIFGNSNTGLEALNAFETSILMCNYIQNIFRQLSSPGPIGRGYPFSRTLTLDRRH